MSDQENQLEDSPHPKRRKMLKPLTQKNTTLKRSSAPGTSESAAKKSRSLSIGTGRTFYSEDGDASRFINSSAGVLKKLKLVNFMCHSHFEISFNPRINFISGCNGSGKSAIQTAIVIGLGGVASKTNRSSKIDGLIKHGCNSGTVHIWLSNNGWNAYKPDEYGNSIQIVRHISSSSSSYKIYNQWGKLMSSSKKELDAILTRFRIQPNNPVSVLNQDMARNFLSTNKAEAKYALFKKATLLDEAEELLVKIADEILEQETRIDAKKKAVKHIQEEIDKMSEKIQLVENLKKSREQIFQLQNELAWSKVHRQRDDLSGLMAIRADQEKIRDKLLTEINEATATLNDLETKKQELEETISNLQNECKTREEMRQKLSQEFRLQKKRYEEKCMKCEDTESKIRNLQADRLQIQKSLDEVEKAEAEYKQKKQEAAQDKAKWMDELGDYEGQRKILDEEMTRLRSTAEYHKEQMHHTETEIRNCLQQIAQNTQHMNGLGKSDSLSMYEGWMPNLVRSIDAAVRANKFTKPPRGPLGRYIKVKSEKWICCIESHLSSKFLNAFLVNDHRDRTELYKIMDSVITRGRRPDAHVSRFQERKRDAMLPEIETSYPGHLNMFRAITFSDTVVANFLIDHRNIHTILLVDNDESCRRFVENDANIPPKCHLILNLNADEYKAGYRFYSNPHPLKRGRLLRKSAADQLRGLKEEIEERKARIEQVKTEQEQHRNASNEFYKKINETSVEIHKLKSKIAGTRRKIQELSDLMDMETPSLQAQLEELKEVENEMAQLEAAKKVLQEEREEGMHKMQEAKKRMQTEGQTDFFAQQTEINAQKEKTVRSLSKLQNRVNELNRKVDEQNQKVGTLNVRIKDAEQKLTTEEDTASQLSDEFTEVRPVSEIQNEIEGLQCFITEAENKLGTEEINFEKQYWDKKSAHHNFVKLFKELTDLHAKLKKMNVERKNVIASLRDVNANVIIAEFQVVLKSRNYTGSLKFDHERRKLDILMAPTDGGNTLMNTNSLSGGEKSYSTVAFLLALWSNMELPFYSMDEYDVFMDAINRKTITKLLMAFAEKKDSRQFIFLTPLDVSIIQPGAHVQIHKVNKLQQ